MTDEIAQEAAQAPTPPEDAQSSPEPEESSTPAPEQTVAEPESPPETDEPKKSRASERIAELVAERTAAKEYGEYMRQEVVSLQSQLAGKQLPQETATPKPKLEDFEFDQDKWATAFSDWSVKEASKVAEAQVNKTLREQETANEQAVIQATWQQKSEEFAEENPDFTTVTSNPSLPITKDMAAVFMESEKGPEIAYHLGKNPTEAARISRMSPRKMAMAIGRLENEVSKLAPKPQPTSAPEPPTPIGGQPPGQKLENIPEMDDWMVARREELRAKGRR